MSHVITRGARAAGALVITIVILAALFLTAARLGWLNAIGIRSADSNTQVINAIKRTQEVSLLRLGIQGLSEQDKNTTVFGVDVPGSGEKVFLQYEFDAKLGIDGSQVSIAKTGEKSYRITVPAFAFIGYSDPTFKVAATDGGVLSWVTPDIDQVEMVNEVLNDDARQKYIDSNEEILQDQAQAFYDGIIQSVDPAITTTYTFQS